MGNTGNTETGKGAVPVGKEALIRCVEVKREIEWLEKRIMSLRTDIDRLESGGTVRDMVKGGSGNEQIYHIEGMPVRDLQKKKSLIVTRIERLSEKQVELEQALANAEEYIMSIEDTRVRQALQRIYVDGWTQRQTGNAMHLDQSVISRCIQDYI